MLSSLCTAGPAFTVFLLILAAAAISDLARLTIPNVFPLALVFLFFAAAPPSLQWSSHLGATVLVFAIGLVLFQLRIFGGGDVKLWAAVALWTGLDLLPEQSAITALLGGALTMALVAVRRVAPRRNGSDLNPGSSLFASVREPGAPIPYGLAIAGGALVIAPRLPTLPM